MSDARESRLLDRLAALLHKVAVGDPRLLEHDRRRRVDRHRAFSLGACRLLLREAAARSEHLCNVAFRERRRQQRRNVDKRMGVERLGCHIVDLVDNAAGHGAALEHDDGGISVPAREVARGVVDARRGELLE